MNDPIGKLIESLGITKRDLVKSIIAEYFFADFGTVKVVHGSPPTSVDVQHSVQPMLFGQQLPTTESTNVELLFIGGGAEMSFEWDVNEGDPVLLLGMRDVLSAATPEPAPPTVTLHYTQEALKAIPLGPFKSGATFVIRVTGGVLQLAGTSYAMALYEPLNTALQSLVTAINAKFATKADNPGAAGGLTLDISGSKSAKVKAGG